MWRAALLAQSQVDQAEVELLVHFVVEAVEVEVPRHFFQEVQAEEVLYLPEVVAVVDQVLVEVLLEVVDLVY